MGVFLQAQTTRYAQDQDNCYGYMWHSLMGRSYFWQDTTVFLGTKKENFTMVPMGICVL